MARYASCWITSLVTIGNCSKVSCTSMTVPSDRSRTMPMMSGIVCPLSPRRRPDRRQAMALASPFRCRAALTSAHPCVVRGGQHVGHRLVARRLAAGLLGGLQVERYRLDLAHLRG